MSNRRGQHHPGKSSNFQRLGYVEEGFEVVAGRVGESDQGDGLAGDKPDLRKGLVAVGEGCDTLYSSTIHCYYNYYLCPNKLHDDPYFILWDKQCHNLLNEFIEDGQSESKNEK